MNIVIVGAGWTGCTISKRLESIKDADVIIYEKEERVGGACGTFSLGSYMYDTHAPHIFHTKDEEIWNFVRKFASFNGYQHERGVLLPDGKVIPFPPRDEDLEMLPLGNPPYHDPLFDRHGPHFEGATRERVGDDAYTWLYEMYTRTQWNLDPREIQVSLASRTSQKHETTLSFPGEFQGLPFGGYSQLLNNMIVERKIDLGVDCRESPGCITNADIVFFSGCLTDLLPGDCRVLPYRGQSQSLTFGHWKWPYTTINYSNPDGLLLKMHCYNWFYENVRPSDDQSSLIGFTYADSEPKLYPVPVAGAEELYLGILRRVIVEYPNLIPCGRLGLYKYLDMDRAVRAAWMVADLIRGWNRMHSMDKYESILHIRNFV